MWMFSVKQVLFIFSNTARMISFFLPQIEKVEVGPRKAMVK